MNIERAPLDVKRRCGTEEGKSKRKRQSKRKEYVAGRKHEKARKVGGVVLLCPSSLLLSSQERRYSGQERRYSRGPAHSGLNDMLCATTLRDRMDLYALEAMPIRLGNLR
ncbi:hypothetical protein SUGI_0142060 [Cryptomeria japonica]|nr:hypothetical protein SUGI_0142060 [Cryptomeria japonica]